MLERITAIDELRQDRIDAARVRIASGSIETPEVVDVVIDKLAEELFGEVGAVPQDA